MFTKRLHVIPASSVARSWAVVMGALLLAAAAAAAPMAEKLTPADRQAIESTIRRQIDAFAAGDADRAFAIATPEIQRQFGDAERFMQTVRDHYDAVYHPGGLYFTRLAQSDGEWIQTVQVTDREGRVWRALFTMRRQPDRGWKVGGCQLLETSALAT